MSQRFYFREEDGTIERTSTDEVAPYGNENATAIKCLRMGMQPSVTTVLDVHREEYLERWLLAQAIEEYKKCKNIKQAVNEIYTRESENADFGTACHAIIEAWLLDLPVPDVSDLAKKHAAPLIKWLEANVKEKIFAERLLFSTEVGSAGCADIGIKLRNGVRVLGDLKVVKFSMKFPPKPGLSYKMQLSAYEAMLEETELGGNWERVSFYLASHFGWDKSPDLKIFHHKQCYRKAFAAARVLWEAKLLQEDIKPVHGMLCAEAFDPTDFRK